MNKEFCVNYEVCESVNYTNRKVYTVKVKTDKGVFAQEVMLDDIDGYTKALKDLGYTETFLVFHSSDKVCDWWWD